MDIVQRIRQDLQEQADPLRAQISPSYFKLEPGDHDDFLGVTVPKQRVIVRRYYKEITPAQVEQLLHSTIHEERLTALMIWVLQYQKGDDDTKADIYTRYLANTKWINSWDFVDASCRDIVGAYLFNKDQSVLSALSDSANIWERRIAIVSTWYFIRLGEFGWTLKLAEHYLNDTHHYIHKATGWMLREVGKRDRAVLVDFLDAHATKMPRTALRSAIEHFPPEQRALYLQKK